MPLWRATVIVMVAGCVLAACGESDQQTADPIVRGAPGATQGPQVPTGYPGLSVADPGDLREKPEVVIDKSAEAPRRLTVRDLVDGSGPRVEAGDNVSVQYIGQSFSDGQEFDSTWAKGGTPFTFPLGAQQVIAGWDRGVARMRVGGRRLLVIPPALGYGRDGVPPTIKPNETLIFVIDVTGRRAGAR
jgi:peptidylprolyl isomerase